MNSMMLGNRLTGKLTVRNLLALTPEDATTVLDAMTGGIKEWFDGLPPTKKQTSDSQIVRAPLQMTITVTDGSKTFAWVSTFPAGGYASASELLGKTVTFNEAGPLNRLDKALTLLKPHVGASGNVLATFWPDAIGFNSTSIRIANRPIWEGETSGRWALIPMEGEFYPNLDGWGSQGRSPQSGTPRFYQTGPLNPTLNSSPAWFLRVWPLPNQRGTLNYILETIAPTLTLDAFQVPVDIPVPDEDMPDVLALCEERLVGTPLWSPGADKQAAIGASTRSRDRLQRLWVPQDASGAGIALPCNW